MLKEICRTGAMMNLAQALDKEVHDFEQKLCEVERVKALLSGSISRTDYAALLTAFYFIEHQSRLAVTAAQCILHRRDAYLSKRFQLCADGEQGHAEMALADLRDLGVESVFPFSSPKISEYASLLQQEAAQRPHNILGHSFLFETASGILFPQVDEVSYPSMFVQTHALEDPKHTIAIKQTVKNVDKRIEADVKAGLIEFSRLSGSRFLELLPLFQA